MSWFSFIELQSMHPAVKFESCSIYSSRITKNIIYHTKKKQHFDQMKFFQSTPKEYRQYLFKEFLNQIYADIRKSDII